MCAIIIASKASCAALRNSATALLQPVMRHRYPANNGNQPKADVPSIFAAVEMIAPSRPVRTKLRVPVT